MLNPTQLTKTLRKVRKSPKIIKMDGSKFYFFTSLFLFSNYRNNKVPKNFYENLFPNLSIRKKPIITNDLKNNVLIVNKLYNKSF